MWQVGASIVYYCGYYTIFSIWMEGGNPCTYHFHHCVYVSLYSSIVAFGRNMWYTLLVLHRQTFGTISVKHLSKGVGLNKVWCAGIPILGITSKKRIVVTFIPKKYYSVAAYCSILLLLGRAVWVQSPVASWIKILYCLFAIFQFFSPAPWLISLLVYTKWCTGCWAHSVAASDWHQFHSVWVELDDFLVVWKLVHCGQISWIILDIMVSVKK